MAKIALDLKKDGRGPGGGTDPRLPKASLVANGTDWTVSDVVCESGPSDRPFEEFHSRPTIAIVVGGTFQYRSRNSRELMTPGSLLLGSEGQSFECGHEHGSGDRCISFSYSPEFFERLVADMGAGGSWTGFKMLRLPPVRILSQLVAAASAPLAGYNPVDWEELLTRLALKTLQLDRGLSQVYFTPEPGAVARVTRIVRMIERHPDASHSLGMLAREARLSPYHFLRTFERLTGVTPHQYILRTRLRRAAIRVSTGSAKIIDIALESGFGDISNFTRTFRAEFGVSPRKYRMQMGLRSKAV